MERCVTIRHKGDYLYGSFYKHGEDGRFATVNPATGARLDRVPWRRASLDQALADARAMARAWGDAAASQRIDILRRVRDALDSRRSLLSSMASLEMGKPQWEADLEVITAIRAVELMLEEGSALLGVKPHPSAPGAVRRRPVGVVGAITAFPAPIAGPVQLLVPLLAAGNTVIWNPSSQVPLTSQLVAEAFDSARVPDGVLAMVQGTGEVVGAALAQHPGVDLLAATGDAATGRDLHNRPGRTWFQAGGKGWAFVAADADLDRAAYEVVAGAFLSCGQRCNSTARVLVESSVAREFLKRVVALTRGLTVGPPESPESFTGPLVDEAAAQVFDAVLSKYRAEGIEFPVEGGRGAMPKSLLKPGTAYAGPAIALTDAPLPDDLPLPEDVEGPLLVARLVDSLETGVASWQSQPYGMSAAIFTSQQSRFDSLAPRICAGTVNHNRGTIVTSSRFPNAGMRGSGQGAEANAQLMLAASWPQATLSASGRFDPSHRVPGMAWPQEMGIIDPSSLATPPYRPGDDTNQLPLPPRKR